jgi:hypothetical protein
MMQNVHIIPVNLYQLKFIFFRNIGKLNDLL